jgi:hypothetical protein
MYRFISLLFIFLLAACANTQRVENTDRSIPIKIENPTVYDVYFDKARFVREQRIDGRSSGIVRLLVGDNELTGGFDIRYKMPLTETVPIFVTGDHRTIQKGQISFTINEPKITENHGKHLVIRNHADNAIILGNGGEPKPFVEQVGDAYTNAQLQPVAVREFSPNESAVFDISKELDLSRYYIEDTRRRIPLNLPKNIPNNYIYEFVYERSGAKLVDVRPLHRAGEPSWAISINDATAPLFATASDSEINLFAPTDSGINRYRFDSAGGLRNQIAAEGSFNITFAQQIGDSFLLSGYEEYRIGEYFPVAKRVRNADGIEESTLEDDDRIGFFHAAYSGDRWLLVGGIEDFNEHTAYARLVQEDGHDISTVWELDNDDFKGKISKNKQNFHFGTIYSAAYDITQKRWLVAGYNIEWDGFDYIYGSYIAFIDELGVIQSVDISSFKEMGINKVLVDSDGSYYLVGDVEHANETRTILIKFAADGKRVWQYASQHATRAYYQDAVLDMKHNQIVLAGTMAAHDSAGTGGTPFIEAVSVADGKRQWIESLDDPDFNGANLVTRVAHAPDYGFVLTLSGVANGGIAAPFVVGRVNSYGKFRR